MGLKCRHCGYQWNYRGENKFYATCPRCHYKVKVPEKKVRGVGQGRFGLELGRSSTNNSAKLLGIAGMVNKVMGDHRLWDKNIR